MAELIKIEDTEMQVREYNGQRVVTFKDIDAVHQRAKGTARNAFNRNKKYFIKGVDYITLTPEEQANIDYVRLTYIPTKGITLLTESGYLMVVKTFNDDLSWQVQRQLVNAYFKVREPERVVPAITQKYHTSNTPVPRNPNWYIRNRRRIKRLCDRLNIQISDFNHNLLVRLGEEFDLDAANEIYEAELGKSPEYALDVVSYFPEVAELADAYLTSLEKFFLK